MKSSYKVRKSNQTSNLQKTPKLPTSQPSSPNNSILDFFHKSNTCWSQPLSKEIDVIRKTVAQLTPKKIHSDEAIQPKQSGIEFDRPKAKKRSIDVVDLDNEIVERHAELLSQNIDSILSFFEKSKDFEGMESQFLKKSFVRVLSPKKSNDTNATGSAKVKRRLFEGSENGIAKEEPPNSQFDLENVIEEQAQLLSQHRNAILSIIEKSKQFGDVQDKYLKKYFLKILNNRYNDENIKIEKVETLPEASTSIKIEETDSFASTSIKKEVNNSNIHETKILIKEEPAAHISVDNGLQRSPEKVTPVDPIMYCIDKAKTIANVLFDRQTLEACSAYRKLNQPESRLFLYLLMRNWNWININDENNKYQFVESPASSLSILERHGFIEFMTIQTDINDILNTMHVNELKSLCKLQNLKQIGRKEDFIKELLALTRNVNFFSKDNLTEKIKGRALTLMNARYFKIVGKPREIFLKLLLAATCPYFKGEEPERLRDLKFRLEERRLRNPYLPLEIKPQQLFQTPVQFDEYFCSVNLKGEISAAVKAKKNNLIVDLCKKALEEFKLYMNNSMNKVYLLSLKGKEYMSIFTAGSNYAYCLTLCLTAVKSEKEYNLALSLLDALLSQYHFMQRRRALWYCEKCLILQRYLKKGVSEVVDVLIQGLQDENLSMLGKMVVSKKSDMFSRKKDKALQPKLQLLSSLIIVPRRIYTETIFGKCVPNLTTDRKQRFEIEPMPGNRIIGTVEEVVVEHHHAHFPFHFHDEGDVLRNIVLSLFFDIIYDASVEGVFISELQDRPLDWGSKGFYRRRKLNIKSRIDNLLERGIDGAVEDISEVALKITKHPNVILSSKYISPDTINNLKDLIECITLEKLLCLSDYLLEHFSERKTGFPDLTVYNNQTKEVIFIEVKGPSDEASMNQILWMQKMMDFGINTNICKVNLMSQKCRVDCPDSETLM